MADKEQEQQRGFVVIDRRGTSGEEEREAETRAPRGEPTPAEREAEPEPRTAPQPGQGALPRIDFASFVHSIGISALYHLGLVADPKTGEPAPRDFELARENIDILEMLQQKTRGNLEPEEAQLLESLLYDLRMRFVESKQPTQPTTRE